MNKVLILIIGSALLISIAFFLMYFIGYDLHLEDSVHISVNDRANIGKIIVPLITLFFATRIYRGLGISKKISDEQVNIVIELLRELKRSYVEIDINYFIS